MRGRLMFLAGAATGYVLGAKAGRGRYEQLMTQADTLWNDPRVQEKVGQAQSVVTEKAAAAGSAVVGAAKEKAADLTSKSPAEGDDLQIGSEPGSDYTPRETPYNSAE